MDVSRNHASLQPVGAGKWQIKNLNERNVTFVNGIVVESKMISESDKIELGNSHYLFPWAALQEPKENRSCDLFVCIIRRLRSRPG